MASRFTARLFAACFACAAMVAACSPAGDAPTADPAATPDAAAAGGDIAAAGQTGAAAAAAGMTLPEGMVGRWGLSMEACASTNASKDGVIENTASTVALGLDTCTITRTEPEGAGVHVVAMCKSGEGGADYERDFSFVSSTPETMTWVSEGGAAEPYVRCS